MGSENEETLATHPDQRQRTNPRQSRPRVTDVTDPTQSATYTMKLRANRILCVGALVLLGLVLLSTQVQAESELEPEPTRVLQGYHDYHYDRHPRPCHWKKHWNHWKHWKSGRDGRRLLSRQVKADSDLLSEQMKDDDSDQVFQMRPDSELEPEPTRMLQGYHDGGWDICSHCHYPHCPHWCNTHHPHPPRPVKKPCYKRPKSGKRKGGKSKGGWRGRRD